MSLNDTPRADRLHIGIFGKRNSGKSSLINALTGQDIALVSDTPGTTADPVYKSMELHPVGPVVFIDTAGFDDEGSLGKLRVERTYAALDKTDIAVLVIASDDVETKNLSDEVHWLGLFESRKIPVIIAVNGREDAAGSQNTGRRFSGGSGSDGKPAVEKSADKKSDDGKPAVGRSAAGKSAYEEYAGEKPLFGKYPLIKLNARTGEGIENLRGEIEQAARGDFPCRSILGDIVKEGSLVLLVMPQDIQAPKGRLILPQVQTLRELLDRKCAALSTTADGLESTLGMLNRAPDLIITDSQCFGQVWEAKPEKSRLTSFSVLFAAYKGDIDAFAKGALALDDMTENSKVLIAEACTHVPLSEDIGREKIPNMLRKRYGSGISITNVNGSDFPDAGGLKEFDLVIHCGACMFNRKHVMSRIETALAADVPITNYGIAIAKLTGILDKIEI